MSGHKGMVHYSVEVKREAVRLVQEEHQTDRQVASQLGIREAARIKVLVRMYRQEGEASFHHKPSGRPRTHLAPQAELERLRRENARLKKIPYRIADTAARAAQSQAIYHFARAPVNARSIANCRRWRRIIVIPIS